MYDTLKTTIVHLAADIRELRHQARTTLAHARAASGPAREELYARYRALGIDASVLGEHARVALLAYGFLRGRTYRQLEPRCRPDRQVRGRLLHVAAALAASTGAAVTCESFRAWVEAPAAAPARAATCEAG